MKFLVTGGAGVIGSAVISKGLLEPLLLGVQGAQFRDEK